MPVETKDSGDESNGEGFKEKSGEHKEHGGEKWNGGTELGGPVLVEGNTKDGGKGKKGPESWLETGMPCRREVGEVVDGDIWYGDEAKAADLEGRPPHLEVAVADKDGEVSSGFLLESKLVSMFRIEEVEITNLQLHIFRRI